MSSQALHLLSSSSSFSPIRPRPLLFSGGVWLYRAKDKCVNFDIRPNCSAISQPRTKEYPDVFKKNGGVPLIKWHEIVEDDIEVQVPNKVSISNEIIKRVENIKSMLDSMEDGEISISAYDTTWVALVEDINGSGAPQFPSSLQWIADNQLPDGSWGDSLIFTAHDRIINTLACVIALESWNLHPEKSEKGMKYLLGNIRNSLYARFMREIAKTINNTHNLRDSAETCLLYELLQIFY